MKFDFNLMRARCILGMLVAMVLSSCGGGAGDSGPGSGGSGTTINIAGTVSGAVASGVTINIIAANGQTVVASTTSSSSGAYSFSGVSMSAGSVLFIAAVRTGYYFSPANYQLISAGGGHALNEYGVDSAAHQDFIAVADSASGYSLSGVVSGAAVSGVTVYLTGDHAAGATLTASGAYNFSGLANGNYTITPALAGYTFTPTSRSLTVNGASIGNLVFTSSAVAGGSPSLAAYAGYPYGSSNSSAYADGTGAAAVFRNPVGMATDVVGNLYVADAIHETIRKITPAAVVTTLAGGAGLTGSTDGTGTAARFKYPIGLVTDSVGNLFVTDNNNFTIRKITPAGVVTTFAGTAGAAGSTDATGSAARFYLPYAIAIDHTDNLYVADSGNFTIRKITPAGVVTTLAGTAGTRGHADGTGAAASFDSSLGLAVDSAGNVYVADALYSLIRKITPAGVVTTLAGNVALGLAGGSADGTGTAASFFGPSGITIDSSNNLYVNDGKNNTIRKITPAGAVSTVVGTVGQGGFTPGPLPGTITGKGENFFGSVALIGSSLFITTNDGVAVVRNVP